MNIGSSWNRCAHGQGVQSLFWSGSYPVVMYELLTSVVDVTSNGMFAVGLDYRATVARLASGKPMGLTPELLINLKSKSYH